ncbi:MAG: tetratricopeptide repeat protein [Gemmatimonadales bacterium]|nr:MAG: tetratricopeptide repeat protein [Gemmatimonadales bacterium]
MTEPGQGLEHLLVQARELGAEGDFAGMAEKLRGELDAYPDDPALLCWLGVAERELGLEGVAYERFKQALALDPEDPYILATAGNALAHFDDPDAEVALRAASVMAPDLPLTRWMYGAFLSREGFVAEARRELDEAKAMSPDDATVAYESGVAYALAGDLASAVDEFARALDLAPDESWSRVVLGLALVEDDRLEEGEVELDLAARQRSDDVEAQLVAGLAACASGREEDAWEFLERARFGAQGTDLLTIEAVEERIEDGPDAAGRFLRHTLAPVVFRERLQARP